MSKCPWNGLIMFTVIAIYGNQCNCCQRWKISGSILDISLVHFVFDKHQLNHFIHAFGKQVDGKNIMNLIRLQRNKLWTVQMATRFCEKKCFWDCSKMEITRSYSIGKRRPKCSNSEPATRFWSPFTHYCFCTCYWFHVHWSSPTSEIHFGYQLSNWFWNYSEIFLLIKRLQCLQSVCAWLCDKIAPPEPIKPKLAL